MSILRQELDLVLAVVLAVLRRRAADSEPCPFCNTFIPKGSADCPVCARGLGGWQEKPEGTAQPP